MYGSLCIHMCVYTYTPMTRQDMTHGKGRIKLYVVNFGMFLICMGLSAYICVHTYTQMTRQDLTHGSAPTLQHTATHTRPLPSPPSVGRPSFAEGPPSGIKGVKVTYTFAYIYIHCNRLQHTATHCNTSDKHIRIYSYTFVPYGVASVKRAL